MESYIEIVIRTISATIIGLGYKYLENANITLVDVLRIQIQIGRNITKAKENSFCKIPLKRQTLVHLDLN